MRLLSSASCVIDIVIESILEWRSFIFERSMSMFPLSAVSICPDISDVLLILSFILLLAVSSMPTEFLI